MNSLPVKKRNIVLACLLFLPLLFASTLDWEYNTETINAIGACEDEPSNIRVVFSAVGARLSVWSCKDTPGSSITDIKYFYPWVPYLERIIPP